MNLTRDFRSGNDNPVFMYDLQYIVEQFPEMTAQRTPYEAYKAITASTRDLGEWCEIAVRHEGRLCGFAILTDDDDAHVGPLLGVQWCMVFPWAPKGTMLKIHRECRALAKDANYRFMAYTKRLSTGRYEINYIDLGEQQHGQENQEGLQERHQDPEQGSR